MPPKNKGSRCDFLLMEIIRFKYMKNASALQQGQRPNGVFLPLTRHSAPIFRSSVLSLSKIVPLSEFTCGEMYHQPVLHILHVKVV